MYKKREIALDLTSLLDVILIILFMFVVNTSSALSQSLDEDAQATATPTPTVSAEEIDSELATQIDAKKSELAQIEQQYGDLQQQSESVKKQIVSDEIWMNTCSKINISVDYNEAKDKRIITVQKGVEDAETYEYDSKASYKDVRNYLIDVLKNNYLDLIDEEQIVLFVYAFDNDKVDIENYWIIDQSLKQMQEKYSNVYITFHDLSKSETTVIPKNQTEDKKEPTTVSESATPDEQSSEKTTPAPSAEE